MALNNETIKYSLRNLKMRKARSFLTILSIFVGISAIFIFVSFGLGLYNYVGEFTTGGSADKVIIHSRGGGVPGLDDTFKLTEKDVKAIERVSGVFEVTGSSFAVAEIKKSNEKKFVFISSYDPKIPLIFEISNVDIIKGRELNSKESGKAILGYNYLIDDKIFSKGMGLNDNLDLQGQKTRVVAYLESIGNPQDDSNIYVTQEYFDELYVDRAGNFGWIIARVDIENIDKVVEDIERALRKERGLEIGKEDFHVQSFEELIASFSGALNIIIGFVILIALISVLVSAVNTANTMITSVIERTKEIGIIKAVGAKNSELLKIFLFESAMLGFIAGIIGVLVGFMITSFVNSVLINLGWGFLSPYYSLELFIGCVLFATGTGAISGVIPAIRASKINTVEALRYE
ncbi:MAG: ABC transporter permease [Nanoarchaeota archaeon]|nr:ABC transporter permease [Nanoarchaeota archaeon]